MERRYTRESFKIGIVCALAIEIAAVDALLDEKLPPLERLPRDDTIYTFGRIGKHYVVMSCLPIAKTGVISAASVASDMRRSFPIEFGLMVGIGGGVPGGKADVRLGDVVVSQPTKEHGGIIPYNYAGLDLYSFSDRNRSVYKPSRTLLDALHNLQRRHQTMGDALPETLGLIGRNRPQMAVEYRHPGPNRDHVFVAGYQHRGNAEDCRACDPTKRIPQKSRSSMRPKIHYGNIASGNMVMKDGPTRDKIARQAGILCFEMEAAGFVYSFPCLAIRGICDYADSHKNNHWQRYAAAVAAAYARELLAVFST